MRTRLQLAPDEPVIAVFCPVIRKKISKKFPPNSDQRKCFAASPLGASKTRHSRLRCAGVLQAKIDKNPNP